MTQPASRAFQAQYRGACSRCFESIEIGDLVRYVEDALVHHHHHHASPLVRPERVCDRCYLVTPCECDS